MLYMTSLHVYFKRHWHFRKKKLWKVLVFWNVLHPMLWASLFPEWGSGYETQMGMWISGWRCLWRDEIREFTWYLPDNSKNFDNNYICFQEVYLTCKSLIFSPQHRSHRAPGLFAGCGWAGGCWQVLPAGSVTGRAGDHGWLRDHEGEFCPQHFFL